MNYLKIASGLRLPCGSLLNILVFESVLYQRLLINYYRKKSLLEASFNNG